MIIKLIRNEYNTTSTHGAIKIGTEHIGYTIEPPRKDFVRGKGEPCLPTGTYNIEVRNNPMAGTPSIKICGRYVRSNASVRSCLPANDQNPSIVLLPDSMQDGNIKEVHPEAWMLLLCYLSNAINNNEECKLIIE